MAQTQAIIILLEEEQSDKTTDYMINYVKLKRNRFAGLSSGTFQ